MDNREVFISYHTESAKETVQTICRMLEDAGITCWYAPRDVSGPYARAIIDAIENCQIFLLLVNQRSCASKHVLNEVDTAFDRYNRDEPIELLPFLLEGCELSKDMRYYIRRIHMMDGTRPPADDRLQELVDSICLRLGKEPCRTATVQESGARKQYRLTGSIRYPSTRFVGRRQELDAIAGQMSDVQNKLLLVGMGGIGKSEIAKMYIKEHTADYDVILWVTFDGSLQQTIASDAAFPIDGLSRTDYPGDDQRAYFLRKLRILQQIADRRVLIVMDNFDVTDDPDLEEFCGGSYGVLFTSRYHQDLPSLPQVQIRGITSQEDLLALFRAEYSRAVDNWDTVQKILARLEGHPLSIRLVASTMMSRRLTPEEMLELLQSGAAGMEQKDARAADILFGHLKQLFRVSSLTEQEQYLLKNLSLIGPQGMSTRLFLDWCGVDDFDTIDSLIAKSWVIHDPVADVVHLHPLIADLMEEAVRADPDSCLTLAKSIHFGCYDYETCTNSTWARKVLLDQVAMSVQRRLPEGHESWILATEAAYETRRVMYQVQDSVHYGRALLPYAKTLERKLRILNMIAHVLVLNEREEESLIYARQAMELVAQWPLEQIPQDSGNHIVGILSRLTEIYVELGEPQTAVEYARQARRISPLYYTTYEATCGWSDFHLGRALYYAGQYEEAEQWLREGIELFERSNDLWSANFCYDILALTLAGQGRFEEALTYNQNAYEIILPRYGAEHSTPAKNRQYRGDVYRAMGDYETAAGLYRQAIEIFEKRGLPRRARKLRKLLDTM